MQGVIDCQLFTIQYADIHIIIIIQTIPAILGEGNRVIKIGILNKQKPGQYLGDTGRIMPVVHIFIIKNFTGINIYDAGGAGIKDNVVG